MGLVETAHLSQKFNYMPHLGTKELTFRIDHWHGRHVLPAMGTMLSKALPLFSKVSLQLLGFLQNRVAWLQSQECRRIYLFCDIASESHGIISAALSWLN